MQKIFILFCIIICFVCIRCNRISLKEEGKIPDWYLSIPTDQYYLYSVATALSKDLQLAVDKATIDARADIAHQVSIKMANLQRKMEEENFIYKDTSFINTFAQATKTITEETLKGSKVIKTSIVHEDGFFRAYVLVSYPYSSMNKTLLATIGEHEEIYTRFRASKTFEELESELYKFELREKFFKMPSFPWPPPKASSNYIIPPRLFLLDGEKNTLFDVFVRFKKAFDKNGYDEITLFSIPDGYAMVLQLEQIDENGTPLEIPFRWSIRVKPPSIFSISSYLKALFTSAKGHFRLFVFLITDAPIIYDNTSSLSKNEIINLSNQGVNILPESIAKLDFSKNYNCTLLVYEFEQVDTEHQAIFKSNSEIPAKVHLDKSKILQSLWN